MIERAFLLLVVDSPRFEGALRFLGCLGTASSPSCVAAGAFLCRFLGLVLSPSAGVSSGLDSAGCFLAFVLRVGRGATCGSGAGVDVLSLESTGAIDGVAELSGTIDSSLALFVGASSDTCGWAEVGAERVSSIAADGIDSGTMVGADSETVTFACVDAKVSIDASTATEPGDGSSTTGSGT